MPRSQISRVHLLKAQRPLVPEIFLSIYITFMNETLLERHFIVTPTYIARRNTNITEQEFTHPIIEFLERDLHKMSKLGDLLNEFRSNWKESLRSRLIPMLNAKGLAKPQSCENCMSLASKYPRQERLDKIPDSHFDEVRSLKDRKAQGKLIAALTKERDSGRTIPLKKWQQMVRSEKEKTGQLIRHGRRSAKALA
jgi:hypothetical protein